MSEEEPAELVPASAVSPNIDNQGLDFLFGKLPERLLNEFRIGNASLAALVIESADGEDGRCAAIAELIERTFGRPCRDIAPVE